MTDRIRVLEFITSFYLGGTERQFVNLVEGLEGTDFDVHVACFKAQGVLGGSLQANGLPFREYRLPSLRSPAAVTRLAALVRYLKQNRIDVLHTTGPYPNVFGVIAGRLARTPVVIASVRDLGQMWSRSLWATQRQVCRFADAVVTNAEAVRQRLCDQGWDGGKIEVIHNGILPSPPPVTGLGGGLRQELGVSPVAPLVGVVCRLDRLKGLADFLDAAALLARRFPSARFLIVGGPFAGKGSEGQAYMEELRARAAALGLGERVILTGARTDVPSILPELTVSVLSSHTEGLSNSLLESMAAGLPVVATDVGGNPEVVTDGVNGLLVPAAAPRELAAAVSRLLESPRLAGDLGRAARRTVEERFTCERMVRDTTELYRRLLRTSRVRGRGRRLALAGAGEAIPR